MVFVSCWMHCKSFPPSFTSVKVNGSHYACSLPALASRHTDTHAHKKYSHTIFRGFYFSVSREQRKGLKETLVIPLSPCPARGQMKSWSESLNTKFSSSFLSLSLPSLSFLRFARSIQLSTRRSLPIGGSQSSITRLFPSSVPARCLELSGSLLDLNMAFRQLNMAFVMDGWRHRASILG